MIFVKPEHEFLRQMAMVDPDWDAMRDLAVRAMDYGDLTRTALLHQLDGVVAWRLLDERLGAAVPEIVRDHCAQYLVGLAHQNAAWFDNLRRVTDALEDRIMRWFMAGGPAGYAPLYGGEVSHWPRSWHDIDMSIEYETPDDLRPLADDLGAELVEYWEDGWWHLVLPDGMVVELRSPREVDRPAHDEWAGDHRVVTALGLPLRFPDNDVLADDWVRQTCNQVLYRGKRLPLWALARLAAWDITELPSGCPRGAHARWVLGLSDAAYGSGQAGPSVCPPFSYEIAPEGRRPDNAGYHKGHLRKWSAGRYRWLKMPTVEDLLFNLPEGEPDRVAAGYWDRGQGPD